MLVAANPLIEVRLGLMVWTIVCFGITFFVLKRFAFGAIQKIIDERRERIPTVQPKHVEKLERLIDELNGIVGPLQNFLLPGGSPGAAQLHVARTICRRAEREVLAGAEDVELNPLVLVYLNRLSDLLFILARSANAAAGTDEPLWEPGSSR